MKHYWSTIPSSQEKLPLSMLELKASLNQRKKKNNSKNYGSFVIDINHHQPNKFIHCNQI